ncbi:MAG: hypothetical protein PVG30_08905 [Gammaproteobacteria bacterium]|jgi:hypothetical protein
MAFGRQLGHVLNVGWNWLKKTVKKYFVYNTFKKIHKYVQKGVINGGADSALVLFTVDDYFHAVIKRLPKTAALTLFILWMTGCITLNIADLAADDLEKLAKGNLKTFFASCKFCIRPLLSFLNGFNTVGVPTFLFVEVFNFDKLFSDENYINFQSIIMAVSFLLGLYDAQKTLRVELQNLCKARNNKVKKCSSQGEKCLSTIDSIENSKCVMALKLIIEIPRLVLYNYLDWTALGFYLSFIRKLFDLKLPFEFGSKTTIPFVLTTTAVIPKTLHALTNFFAKKYKKDAQTNSETPKNLFWKKFILAVSKFLNISYDILSRFGAVTVVFLVIKHTLEIINDVSYDGTRAAEISEILTMCAAALSMFHEGIDSAIRNFQEYKDDLEKIINGKVGDIAQENKDEKQPLIINNPVQKSITS